MGTDDSPIALYEEEGGERGLLAAQDVGVGDVLARVPLRLAITDVLDPQGRAALVDGVRAHTCTCVWPGVTLMLCTCPPISPSRPLTPFICRVLSTSFSGLPLARQIGSSAAAAAGSRTNGPLVAILAGIAAQRAQCVMCLFSC